MEYPNLDSAKRICIDIESYDPQLKEKGPGFVYGDGRSFVVGVAVAWEGGSLYMPWRHAAENVDIEQSKNFLASLKTQDIIGANLHYDLEGLRSEGVTFFPNQKRDIQVAQFLINDTQKSYNLSTLAEQYLNRPKQADALQQKCTQRLGEKHDAYLNMHNLYASDVEEYARMDAELTLQVYEKQLPLLQADGLMEAFQLECDLINYVQDVRFRGLRIDEERAWQVHKEFHTLYEQSLHKLCILSGNKDFNIWANDDVEKAAIELNLKYGKTAKGSPSFAAPWLETQPQEFWKQLRTARVLDRNGGVYVKAKIIDLVHNGRLYYQLQQVRGDNGGTISSRFSSRNPNMQQIPSRNSELGNKIRSIFLPEPGELWVSMDESQAEVRATVHYAKQLKLAGADLAQSMYRNDPTTDYHQWVADLTGLSRRDAKTITFAILYGAGAGKIQETLGVSTDKARSIIAQYNSKLTFARPLAEMCKRVAQTRGYIKTLIGRRRQFNLFGPSQWEPGLIPKPYDEAVKEFGSVNRYFVHKALNALIQSSCADIHKLSLRNLYNEKMSLCILPIHDELNFSIGNLEEIPAIKKTILDSYCLAVPRVVDVKIGTNFGVLAIYDK